MITVRDDISMDHKPLPISHIKSRRVIEVSGDNEAHTTLRARE